MEIRREAYLNQLIERRDNGMIKIVTGIRRCGKSYLLFTIFKRYLLESGVPEDHIIEIALDGIENEELRDPKVCFRYITDAMRGDGPYYLLLDEVQFMPRFEEVLNSLLRMSNIDVYVTGSNSKFLSSDIVTRNFAAAVTRYAFIRCRLQSSIRSGTVTLTMPGTNICSTAVCRRS